MFNVPDYRDIHKSVDFWNFGWLCVEARQLVKRVKLISTQLLKYTINKGAGFRRTGSDRNGPHNSDQWLS